MKTRWWSQGNENGYSEGQRNRCQYITPWHVRPQHTSRVTHVAPIRHILARNRVEVVEGLLVNLLRSVGQLPASRERAGVDGCGEAHAHEAEEDGQSVRQRPLGRDHCARRVEV